MGRGSHSCTATARYSAEPWQVCGSPLLSSAGQVSSLPQPSTCPPTARPRSGNRLKHTLLCILICMFPQVACNTTINFFKREIDSWPRHNPSLTALFDTNHDDRVYIEEVYNKLRDYARMAFTVLDEDKDGSLANEADAGNILKKFSTEFFKKVLAIAVDYFDSNNDNIVDQSDAFFMDGYEERGVFRRYLDRNWDGHVALSEALHVPSLYHIPGPFYGLYSRIDKNLDEKLTLEEATNATINLFSLVDSDSDCYVTPAEVIAMLDDVGLLWD